MTTIKTNMSKSYTIDTDSEPNHVHDCPKCRSCYKPGQNKIDLRCGHSLCQKCIVSLPRRVLYPGFIVPFCPTCGVQAIDVKTNSEECCDTPNQIIKDGQQSSSQDGAVESGLIPQCGTYINFCSCCPKKNAIKFDPRTGDLLCKECVDRFNEKKKRGGNPNPQRLLCDIEMTGDNHKYIIVPNDLCPTCGEPLTMVKKGTNSFFCQNCDLTTQRETPKDYKEELCKNAERVMENQCEALRINAMNTQLFDDCGTKQQKSRYEALKTIAEFEQKVRNCVTEFHKSECRKLESESRDSVNQLVERHNSLLQQLDTLKIVLYQLKEIKQSSLDNAHTTFAAYKAISMAEKSVVTNVQKRNAKRKEEGCKSIQSAFFEHSDENGKDKSKQFRDSIAATPNPTVLPIPNITNLSAEAGKSNVTITGDIAGPINDEIIVEYGNCTKTIIPDTWTKAAHTIADGKITFTITKCNSFMIRMFLKRGIIEGPIQTYRFHETTKLWEYHQPEEDSSDESDEAYEFVDQPIF